MRSVFLCTCAATLAMVVLCPVNLVGWISSISAFQAAEESANLWGGQHVRMQVTSTGANLDFDCATGTIEQPLALSQDGTFRANGTYTQEHGGPVTKDGNPAVQATYIGTVKGGAMHLQIELVTSKQTVGSFDLGRGSSGHLVKCR